MINFQAINQNRARALSSVAAQRISEVARIANQYQQQGMTRTEALRAAERVVPQ